MIRDVTLIMLTWNGLEYTKECLRTLRENTVLDEHCRLIVVDNGSSDGTVEFLRAQPDLTLIENDENLGFVRGNNVGIRAADQNSDIVLINNDLVFIQPGWLDEMQRVAYATPDTGIVGCRLLMPDGRLLHAGTEMSVSTFWGQQIGSNEKDVNQYNHNRQVEGVVAACMYIKRDILNSIGPLSEDYVSYFEDTDFCLRAAQAGYKTVCAGGVTLIHHENVSTKANRVNFSSIFLKSQRVFKRKWAAYFRDRFELGVAWRVHGKEPSAYSRHSRELLWQLDALAVDVRLVYPGHHSWLDGQGEEVKVAEMRQRTWDRSLPQVAFGAGNVLAENDGRYRIGYVLVDVDKAPDEWMLRANEMDEVWVPSAFSREAFLSAGLQKPIHVMPLGVNPDYFNPLIRTYRPSERFVFLSVSDWSDCQPVDVLLRAFTEEFSERDAVVLLLRVDTELDISVHQQISDMELRDGAAPVVLLYDQDIPLHQKGALYRSADCFVLPTRGEGWGMPILEAMACGLPVIATDWGGHTEYMRADIAYPLRVRELLPVARPGYAGARWAEPDVAHLRQLMRHVYQHRDEAAEKGRLASREALSRWTWRHAAEKIKARLLEIGG